MPGAKWNFTVGKGDCSLDLDEFRVSLRAASAAEIKSWATRDTASQGVFGEGCGGIGNHGATLDSNSAPSLGNANHKFEIFGFPNSIYRFGIGASRLNLSGLDLPLDLGVLKRAWSACLWRTSADSWVSGNLDIGGRGVVNAPIPNNAQFIGVTFYSQAYLLYPPTGMFMLSNAVASSVGH